VFLGRAMKFFFGPSLGGGAIAPLAPPVDPPLIATAYSAGIVSKRLNLSLKTFSIVNLNKIVKI